MVQKQCCSEFYRGCPKHYRNLNTDRIPRAETLTSRQVESKPRKSTCPHSCVSGFARTSPIASRPHPAQRHLNFIQTTNTQMCSNRNPRTNTARPAKDWRSSPIPRNSQCRTRYGPCMRATCTCVQLRKACGPGCACNPDLCLNDNGYTRSSGRPIRGRGY
jgi:hypothetical protein